jgi:hypothetical protein
MSQISTIRGNNLIIPYTAATRKTKQVSNTVLSITGNNGWNTIAASAMAWADSSGKWYLQLTAAATSSGAGSIYCDVTGIVFKNTSNYRQSFSTGDGSTGNTGLGYVLENGNRIYMSSSSGSNGYWFITGIIFELESKPTWADANLDGLVEADIYIPFGTTGMPGETKFASCDDTLTYVNNSTQDVSGMSITLGAGKWEIGYDVNLVLYNNTGSAVAGVGKVFIADSSDNAIAASESFCQSPVLANGDGPVMPASKKVFVTLTASTTYKIRITSVALNFKVGVLGTGVPAYSNIWATRIAPAQ